MELQMNPAAQVWDTTRGLSPGRGRMEGRKIVVIGAGQRHTVDDVPPVGNGRAISLLCAREGAEVACVDVNAAAAEETVACIRKEGGVARSYVCDVADVDAIHRTIDTVLRDMDGADGLAVGVGISAGTRFGDLTPEQWDHEHAVNVRSNMVLGQRAVRDFAEGSSIVLLSSLAALRSASGNPSYEVTKSSQVTLARGIAVAGQPRGVRCNAILPGLMDTPMGRDATRKRPARLGMPLPFARQGTGWEVAHSALFLLSHESSYVNAHALVVDGGAIYGAASPAHSEN